MDLLIIFLTGLTTGGLSCLAMQGGLLASVIANQKDQELAESAADKEIKKARLREKYLKTIKNSQWLTVTLDELDILPVLMFLGAKLVSHTILGFLLGTLGSVITLSLGVRIAFQIFTALFMFGTAMNLLNVHPIFRYIAFQPPKFLQRAVRNTSRSRALFAPAVLGMLTIFIPCGVTQAMEVLAINTGNPIYGALIMFSFVLGTSPLFAILGVATAKLSESWNQVFNKVAAYTLIVMAIYGANGALLVIGSPLTLNKLVRPVTYFFSEERFAGGASGMAAIEDGKQQVKISILNSGYEPRYVRVKAGIPVNLTLESQDAYSCALAFVMRDFGINTFLKSTDLQTFTFTPNKPGKYTYTCSMGMYTGTLEVI